MEKLHAKKMWFWETGMSSWHNEKNREKTGFAFFTLAEWWKWKILHWLTLMGFTRASLEAKKTISGEVASEEAHVKYKKSAR